MVPEELRADLVRMEKRGYDDIHEYVTSQITLPREEAMRKRGLKYPLNAVREEEVPVPDSDELDSLIRQGGRFQRPGGGGKGPMTGAFTGDCHWEKGPPQRRVREEEGRYFQGRLAPVWLRTETLC